MKRFYRLNDRQIINIDDISLIDYDRSINKYIILISGLSNSIYIEEDDALCIISKLNIVNGF